MISRWTIPGLASALALACATRGQPSATPPANAGHGANDGSVSAGASAAAGASLPELRLYADGSLRMGERTLGPSEPLDALASWGGFGSPAAPRRLALRVSSGAPDERLTGSVQQLRKLGVTELSVVLEPGAPGAPHESQATGSTAAGDPLPPAGGTETGTPTPAGSAEVPSGAGSAPTPSPSAGAPAVGSPGIGPSLPEVVIRTVGIHIGGGPNDDTSRAAYKRQVEAKFESFRRCFLLVEEPRRPGVFGVDLDISGQGGRAKVRQPRTTMGPSAFRDCVLEAFQGIEFDRPARGATTVSYSIRFALDGI